ncbi:hypothetical protein SMD11_6151 [Streptomyces albireticuli]|uniref:Uncharacterized protein n=1 Tax=Streptomyces albireticuli TaxID=1940 RepID=A0A1Z2LBQ9_9ACTN|nr:hypothetical protein SMD11_6151 [Streptomyces albireticuli]
MGDQIGDMGEEVSQRPARSVGQAGYRMACVCEISAATIGSGAFCQSS